MFALELAFSTDPDDQAARLAARPAHREAMATLREQGKVLVGGPWADGTGALIVFLVNSVEEAKSLVAADPYFSTRGVEVVALREWDGVTRHDAVADL